MLGSTLVLQAAQTRLFYILNIPKVGIVYIPGSLMVYVPMSRLDWCVVLSGSSLFGTQSWPCCGGSTMDGVSPG